MVSKGGILIALVLLTAVAALSVAQATTVTGTPSATNVISSGAQIVWTTDVASDSQVNYGSGPSSLSGYSANRCDGGGNVTSHCVNLTGLTAGMLYYYKVTSCAEGQGCGESSVQTFTSGSGGGGGGGGDGPPAPPASLTNGPPTTTTIPLFWDAPTNATHYNIEREIANSQSWTFLPIQYGTNYTDIELTPGTTYNYRIEACRSGYGCSSKTYLMGVTTVAATPAAPTGLALNGTPTSSSIPLVWTDNATNEDHYYVERKLTTDSNYSGNILAELSANVTTYTDTGVTAGTTYDYRVKACLGTSCSGYVYLIGVSSASGDTTAPTTPTGLTATSTSASQIILNWTASTDNVGVTGYKIYRNGSYLFTITTPNLTETSLSAGTTYSYYIKAVDAAGNESASSATVSATTHSSGGGGGGDTTAPTTPTGLGAAPMSSSQINLTWTASTDNIGVTGYKIYRNGSYLFTVTTTNLTETGLTAATTYSYYIKAVDAAGNESGQSTTVSATTLTGGSGGSGGDWTAPTTPTGLVATKNYHNEVNLIWSPSTDNVGVVMYHVLRSQSGYWSYIGQTSSAPTSNSPFVDLSVTPATSYYYAVKAYDANGNYSATSTPLFLNTPAASSGGSSFPPSPTMPTAYFVPNGSYGSSTNIMWTDVANETSYKVYERMQGSGSGLWVLAKIRTGPETLVDAIYTANTVSVQVRAYSTGTYEYKVSACNSYGCSDSPSVSVVMGGGTTTPPPTTSGDVTLPTAPTNVTYTAASSSIAFNFYGATDNVGVLGFKVYRNETLIKTVYEPFCLDTGLTPNTTYSYYLVAFDAAGNQSPQTPRIYVTTLSATATTTATPPPSSGSSPNAPSNLRLAGPTTATSIPLAWNDNSSIEDRFNIERQRSGGSFVGAFLAQLSANTTTYTDITVSSGVYYDYRIQACRSGYGCSDYTYLSGVSTSGSVSTSSSSTQGGGVSATVIRGTSYCDGSTGKTPITYSVTPYGAAFFRVSMLVPTAVTTVVAPGTYMLPNGSYRWEAVPYTGYTLSGKLSDEFVLDQRCFTSTATTTTSNTTTTEPFTTSFKPYVVLNGESVVRIPYDGTYEEAGARGYLSPDGGAVSPKRLLGGLDTKTPGTYTLTYQLLSPTTGAVVASVTRTVIVEPKPFTAEPTPTPTLTSVTPPPEPLPLPTSADMITTAEQYTRYCDDPKNALECQSYSTAKVVSTESFAPVTSFIVVAQETFATAPTTEIIEEVQLPVTVTDAKQFNAVCAQADHVETCADALVERGLITQDEADRRVGEVLAKAEEVTKIFTERIGARSFEDTDGDGITNYDEVNIYNTDPINADTNKDGIKDGDQLLLGQNPALSPPASAEGGASSVAPVPPSQVPVIQSDEKATAYEDPRFVGNVKKEIFEAPTVKAESIIPAAGASEGAQQAKITLGGKSLPNSFVTIYIFSDPIVVTVKTDANGSWTYTLDKELPDGSHEIYSAITDAGGRILAKSEPLPFVKTAAAVSVGSPLLLPANEAPGFFSGASLYALIFMVVGVLGFGISVTGFIASRRRDGGGAPPAASA